MIPPFSFLRPCCEKFEIVESNICVVGGRIYLIFYLEGVDEMMMLMLIFRHHLPS
jgi:hypothetical protein